MNAHSDDYFPPLIIAKRARNTKVRIKTIPPIFLRLAKWKERNPNVPGLLMHIHAAQIRDANT